jgi:hypothetical protein
MEPERPNDLGERAIPAELEIGKKYYYRTFGPYAKLTITRIRYGPNGYMWVDGVYENGTEKGPLGIGRTDYNKFYHINPKPVQRAIGEVFVRKTPSISSGPGTPANLVRKFLDVQPPKVPAVAEESSRRNRSSRKNRRHRKNRNTRKH